MELLMPFQSCWRVLVQPSCRTLPHIPWLSGVAVVQVNPPYSAAESAATGTASGNPSGSVALRQPSVRTTTPTTARAGCLISDLFLECALLTVLWRAALGHRSPLGYELLEALSSTRSLAGAL